MATETINEKTQRVYRFGLDEEVVFREDEVKELESCIKDFIRSYECYINVCSCPKADPLPSEQGFNDFIREMIYNYAIAKDIAIYYDIDLNEIDPDKKQYFYAIENSFDIGLCITHLNEYPVIEREYDSYYRGADNLYELMKEVESNKPAIATIKLKKKIVEKKVIKYKRKKK